MLYNEFLGTSYRVIYSVRVCISHDVFKIVVLSKI